MLVLGRRLNQAVRIGEDITVCITDVNLSTGFVKLGFMAPADVVIDREEIYQRKKAGVLHVPKYYDEDDVRCQLKHNTK